MTCPDLLVLSQLLDAELQPDEARSVASHTAGCAGCRDRLDRMGGAQGLASATATHEAVRAALAPVSGETRGCLSPHQLSVWLDPKGPRAERAAIEAHLEGCDACLREALAALRVLARLDAGETQPVPAALQARVASLWPEAVRSGLSELIIRVGRAGAALVERRIVAPILDVVELATPAPALRSGAAPNPLQFQISAPAADIRATVLPVDDTIAVTLLLAGKDGTGLSDQRVSVRRHGRSIFSARTDGRGELRMPGLERGVYEVSCPGIRTEFRLDLRGN